MQYLHELRAGATLPEEDVITFWSRRQAAYPLLAPLAQDLVAAPASQAYVERVFSVRHMQMAYSWPQKQTV